jgi:hypothetical protein
MIYFLSAYQDTNIKIPRLAVTKSAVQLSRLGRSGKEVQIEEDSGVPYQGDSYVKNYVPPSSAAPSKSFPHYKLINYNNNNYQNGTKN